MSFGGAPAGFVPRVGGQSSQDFSRAPEPWWETAIMGAMFLALFVGLPLLMWFVR